MKFGRGGAHEIRRVEEEPESALIAMQREMRPGEKLIWAERPSKLTAHAMEHIVTGLFGIPFLAFALFWTGMASGLLLGEQGGTDTAFDYIFPMFGLPFIIVGLGLVLSPFWGMWTGSRTLYGLSDRRVIIARRGAGGSVSSWALEDIEEVSRKDRGAHGDVVFSRTWVRGNKGGGHWKNHGFIGITEPVRVEHAILAARDALKSKRDSAKV